MPAQQQHSHLLFTNDTATTEIYTLSLHDALPIYGVVLMVVALAAAHCQAHPGRGCGVDSVEDICCLVLDRKSTRLNSSHVEISYAVFCLIKKKYIIPSLRLFTHIVLLVLRGPELI